MPPASSPGVRELLTVTAHAPSIYAALGRLVSRNMEVGRRMVLPPILLSGVRYEREQLKRGEPEHWQVADTLLRSRRGDCEDLACYEVARLRLIGIKASPLLQHQRGGFYHCVVQLPGGQVYDPSLGLGMGSGE